MQNKRRHYAEKQYEARMGQSRCPANPGSGSVFPSDRGVRFSAKERCYWRVSSLVLPKRTLVHLLNLSQALPPARGRLGQ